VRVVFIPSSGIPPQFTGGMKRRRNIKQFRARRDKIPEYAAACCGDLNFEELPFIERGNFSPNGVSRTSASDILVL
jgi:hypothetical protein